MLDLTYPASEEYSQWDAEDDAMAYFAQDALSAYVNNRAVPHNVIAKHTDLYSIRAPLGVRKRFTRRY